MLVPGTASAAPLNADAAEKNVSTIKQTGAQSNIFNNIDGLQSNSSDNSQLAFATGRQGVKHTLCISPGADNLVDNL